jgi:PAS domain S-box-containing protein
MEKIKIILAFCASILIMIVVGIFLFTSTGKYRNNYDWVTHTQNNISEAQSILSYLQDIETSTRGYAITGKEIYLKPYYKALASIDRTFLTLKYAIRDNDTQQHLLETISRLVELKKTFSKKIIDSRERDNFEEASRVISTGIGEGTMSESRTRIAEFIGNEKALLTVRLKNSEESFNNLLLIIAGSIFISVTFIIIALIFFIRDYDKRILSEKKVVESELRTKNFLEALPVGVFIINEQGKPHYANSKSKEILGTGISPADHDSKELGEIYVAYRAETDNPYPLEEIPILRALGGERNVQVDDLEILKDGVRLPLRINASPIVDSQGKIQFAIAVLEDVTEIKKNERALLQANAEIENIFANAPTGIVLLDGDGKITQWNKQAELIFGWESAEVVEKPLQNIILTETYLKANLERTDDFFRAYGKSREGESKTMELSAKTKSNKLIDIEIRVAPTKMNEENFFIVFITDISQRRKTEEALKNKTVQLVEAQRVANIGSWEMDLVNNEVIRSEELCAIYGVSGDELHTDFDTKFIHPADKVYVEKVLQKALVDHSPFNIFFRIVRRDGSERVLNSKGKVYTNMNNEATRVVGTSQDVTDAKNAEKELMKAKQIAEQSLVLKETFLANMSHEIRTPMNAIIGFTDILAKRNLQAQEKEYVQIIKNSGESLLRIINDILDISKIEADMIVFEEHPLSIEEIFKSLQTMLHQKANEKELELIYTADENVPEVLLGDPTRITQILINLTGNAIKFTKKGKVEITAKLIAEEKEKSIIQFLVSDTGIGIPEDKLNSIFERFKQAEDHTTRNYGGTGLGLSIAKQLVELQGGQMSITSKLDKGTQVMFTLPLKKTKEIYKVKTPEEERKFDPEELSKLKILLAEDNPINVKLVLSLFSDYGIEADVAENGKIVIEKLEKNYYDLILMDMEMPEMNGYEATTVIREEMKNKIPIIAMTAHAMAGEREKCFKLGMHDYISKPINANSLFEKIYNATEFVKSWNGGIKKVINLDYLTDIMSGKKELIKETIDIFLKQASEDLPIINDAVDKTDYLTVKRFAHRMKSTITMMGISSLSPVLDEMEVLGKAENDIERIKILNKTLNSTYAQALEEIKIERLKYN